MDSGTILISVIGAVGGIGGAITAIYTAKSQKDATSAKITETIESVYGNVIKTLEKRIKDLENLSDSNHCEIAPNCKNRRK